MNYQEVIDHIRDKLRDSTSNPAFSDIMIMRAIHRAVLNFLSWAMQAERTVEDLGPLAYYRVETNWEVAWDWANGLWGGGATKVEMLTRDPRNGQPGLPSDLYAVYRCIPTKSIRSNQGYILPKYRLEKLVDMSSSPPTPVYVLRFEQPAEGAASAGVLPVNLTYIRKPQLSTVLTTTVDIPEGYTGALIDAVVADLKGSVGEIPEPFAFRHKEVESRIPAELPGGPIS